MKKRRIKAFNKETNKIVSVNPENITLPPIVHQDIPTEYLNRIKTIWDIIKPISPGITLEGFELSFMRDEHMENEIKTWENMVKTLNTVLISTASDTQRREVFDILLYHTLGSLTKEEMKNPIVKAICKFYDNLSGEKITPFKM